MNINNFNSMKNLQSEKWKRVSERKWRYSEILRLSAEDYQALIDDVINSGGCVKEEVYGGTEMIELTINETHEIPVIIQ